MGKKVNEEKVEETVMIDGVQYPQYGIVVVGAGGVGKSSLTLKFIKGQFLEDYDPTIEDTFHHQANVDGSDCQLQEEYRGLWGDKFMRTGEGFLVVFSLVDRQSLGEVRSLCEQIMRVKDKEAGTVPIVLVGNKSDLEGEREVQHDEVDALAKSLKLDAFLETSAKTGANVHEAFHELVRGVKRRREESKRTNGHKPQSGSASSSGKPAGPSQSGCCAIL